MEVVTEHIVATAAFFMQKFPNVVGIKSVLFGLAMSTAVPLATTTYALCRYTDVISWPSLAAVGAGSFSVYRWILFFKSRTAPKDPLPPTDTFGVCHPDASAPRTVKVVVLSDTHSLHTNVSVPDGDILVHCGDFTKRGTRKEIIAFNNWLGKQPHKHKVVVAGNHDLMLDEPFYRECWAEWHGECELGEDERPSSLLSNATAYLQDSAVDIMGLRFYGMPWHPMLPGRRMAFAVPRDSDKLREQCEKIPSGVDVLITHGPVHTQCDKSAFGTPVGCEYLLEAVKRAKPRHAVCGHIHEAYGTSKVQHGDQGDSGVSETVCINAAVCTLGYAPKQTPVIINIHQT